MGTKWTTEQTQAINKTGNNILVAAAAGSGKTAVLVERIITKIVKQKIDIDKLLVVTFTNAAAAEMRERILESIYKKIEECPEDKNLQKQIVLLNKANISTIHSFCLDVIRNYFYEINISPNFRVAEASETTLLKQEVLEEIFENFYGQKDKDFIELTQIYNNYRDDETLKEIILQIYGYIQSTPFPEEWLNEQIEKFNIETNLKKDFSKNIWGKILIENFKEEIATLINSLKMLDQKLYQEEMKKYSLTISEDIIMLEQLLQKEYSWDELYNLVINIKFKTWPIDKKVILDIKDEAKQIRDNVKKRYNDLINKIFMYNSLEANKDIFVMYPIFKKMQKVIMQFSEGYKKQKQERNIIDFNDIEHYALNILVKQDENKNYIPTDIAKIYKEKFEEIAIDEYQDSNLVQEYILTTISRKNNIFMVGDVKQSIYKFRQARPELFLDKYSKYKTSNEDNICKEETKIQLFKNFRSRKDVLDFTNLVFENIMSKKLGDIDYNENEYLNLGADYIENKETSTKPELHVINLSEDDEKDEDIIDNTEVEAEFVANKIKEMIDSDFKIYDKRKQNYRKVTFKDIAILLRTTSNTAHIYEKKLYNLNFPVFTDSGENYLESMEIQTVLAVLKIIDNPNNDIPLITVLRSNIGGFNDNDLIEIRLENKESSFYEALCVAKESSHEKLKQKVNIFLTKLVEWQTKQEYLSLEELIWKIYETTGFYNYVSLLPNGNLRTANLKLLFEKAKDYEKASFKGLYNFISFMDKITRTSVDTGSAKLISENDNVIRIMSIHKSKGLEFPVVFLCGTGKQFNMQDLNQNVILHQDIGLGPKYINYERKIEYNTLAKEAIKIKMKSETLSEEMRLLYVALTRSREKLIITGVDKDLNKSLEEKENLLQICEEKKISNIIVKKSKSYLDWLELVTLHNKNISCLLDVRYYNKTDIKSTDVHKEKENLVIPLNYKISNEIKEKLEWEYLDILATKTEGKTSVSEISKENNKLLLNKKLKILNETESLNKAEIGTIVHLILQKINFKTNYNLDKLNELIENLVLKKIISKNQAESVNIKEILNFTKSKLFKRVQNSKKVFKEKAFYINIPAEKANKEKILVQGIIDLFFIDKNNKLVLVDYKTDNVKNEEALKERYTKQLQIYKQAIEEAIGKKVDEVYIYSTCINKEICLQIM